MIYITKKEAEEIKKRPDTLSISDLSGNEFLIASGVVLAVQYVNEESENKTDSLQPNTT